MEIALVNHNDYLGHGERYADRLVAGLLWNMRRLKGKRSFRILTEKDIPEGIEGWWAKIALFKPGMFERGQRVWYFDMDTVIVDGIEDLLTYDGEFAGISDFYHPEFFQTAIMSWVVTEDTEAIWTVWDKAGRPQFDPRGDAGWISQFVHDADRLQDVFPGKFVSFKADCIDGVPEGASVVCFHGKPRIHVLADLLKHWERE